MRPVDKGLPPLENGVTVVFSKYGDAARYLRDRIGRYCSYCEIELKKGLAVEHVVPKNPVTGNPLLLLSWYNFLLSCDTCNRIKWQQPVTRANYFWADVDNTYRAFQYGPGGTIDVHPALSATQKQIARDTINLTGLDRTPSSNPPSTEADERYRWRDDVWRIAEEARQELLTENTPILKRRIAKHASSMGFFSVWMTVFERDPDMRNLLIDEFKGTRSSNCFDTNGNPVQRIGGKI